VPTSAMPQGVETPKPTPPHGGPPHLDLSRIAQDLQIKKVQVESVVQLLDEGNTVPFITRYRKERTGGLDEEVLRAIQDRVAGLRHLAERKQTILRSIENQGRLTDELRAAVLGADNPKRLEDLYLPYKPKKRTLATAAREKGLEPLALAVWNSDPAVANLAEVLPTMVNPEKELNAPEDVLLGVQHVLAETVAESADVRGVVRMVLWDTGKLKTSKSEKLADGQGREYEDYFDFTEPVRHVPPHRILAINRGEKENALQVKLEWDSEAGYRLALERLPLPLAPAQPAAAPPAVEAAPQPPAPEGAAAPPAGEAALAEAKPAAPAQPHPPHPRRPHHERGPRNPLAPRPELIEALAKHPHADFLRRVTADALTRLLVPSLEREIRRELTDRAEGHAVSVFARNLRSKLLAAPLRGRRVLAIDPGFRTGCKLAALDEHGGLLEDGVVFPHPPQNKKADAKAKLEELVRKHQVHVIAVGNGTACRETEEVVSELIAGLDARRRGVTAPAPEAAPAPPPAPGAAAPPAAPEAAPAPQREAAAPPQAEAPPQPEVTAATTPPAEGATQPAQAEAAAPAPQAAPPPAEPSAPPAPPPPPLPEALPELAYVIVNEAGASVYSASPVGREEFPSFDATLRGTISIGRRLQDPLSELVKIDPQHVGVGLYQHDVPAKQLKESLEGVIESCVNAVGVDLNTASVPLLRHVSGLNQLVARDLVEYRKSHGPFRSREQLKQVPGIGEARFTQAAGFLRVLGGDNPLDSTWVHPESYPVAQQVLHDLGAGPEALTQKEQVEGLRERLKGLSPEEVAARLQVGLPTVKDIFAALARPGRDPREDLPPPVFKKGILKLEDLQPGMELKGTVLNVVDFGAFVDIGLKDSGLVHISRMANRYVKSPYDVVAVGDVVTVWVLEVDQGRHRVSLTMIPPGTERKPPERRPPQQQQRREGPPRGDRPPPRGDRPPPRGGGRRPPPRGQLRGGPPPQGGRREGAPPQPAEAGAQAQGAQAQGAPAQRQPPPPPRKPRRQPPKPNLSQAALAGAAPLGTFAELAAFWEAKRKEAAPQPVPPAPPPEGAPENGTPPA
jgi:protein Tex